MTGHFSATPIPPTRRIFVSRTLNLRAIRAVGFDMDYTLVHYHTRAWEERAYEAARGRLLAAGWPVSDLEFDPDLVSLGLVLDLELGNLVKATRFGYVTRACHGRRPLEFEEQRARYARGLVDLEDRRWVFLNTLFTVSEAALYTALVDRLDAGQLPTGIGYPELYREIRRAVDQVHTEGALKEDIAAAPSRYVDTDPLLPLALLDLKHAGKQLLLITNSEWWYTAAMLEHVLEPGLPAGVGWRDLFDLVIVGARKPSFFSSDGPAFEVMTGEGLLRPHSGALEVGHAYLGASAALVERSLGLSGEQILYLGDHIVADVRASKDLWRWRTGLVLRDLEAELEADGAFAADQQRLLGLMQQKEGLEHEQAGLRLALQRRGGNYGPQFAGATDELHRRLGELRKELEALDGEVAPLARAASELHRPWWGPLLRAGNDKSHLARQIERSADIYTSRVSNLLGYTPFAYLRAPRSSLPHDPVPS